MRNVSLKIKNYKCFGEEYQGFDSILPINIIIGRNNSGKSSLLDLVGNAVNPRDLSERGHKSKKPQAIFKAPLSGEEIKKVFRPGASTVGTLEGDDWHYGRKWIGKKITVEFGANNLLTFIGLENPMDIPNATNWQTRLVEVKESPFMNKRFKLLSAERNITTEEDHSGPVSETGAGATNIIQHFINSKSLDIKLVEETLLQELNKIMKPDSIYTAIKVQKDEGNAWEVYLKESNKGLIALSQSGSGLKTILLVLIFIYLVPSIESQPLNNYIFAFEEIENCLHPALQRRLFLYIREIALKYQTYFFLTTHSNVVIDLFSKDPEAQLIHVMHNGDKATTKHVEAYIDKKGILDDLDVRASDLLQSNAVIWVEGPSDRLYFNRWIEAWTNEELREGAHYQCVFYGGRLLAHLTADVTEDEQMDLIKILLINRNSIIIMDSDKKDKSQPLNDTKKRIIEEMSNKNAICWITKGREIENYIPQNAIASYYEKDVKQSIGQYEKFSDYLERIEKGEGTKFLSKKVLFAENILHYLNKDNLKTSLDLEERLNEVSNCIKEWNG